MTDDLSFGDLRCEQDGDVLSIRPTIAWTGRMIFFICCGMLVMIGLAAGCVGGWMHYREEGGWSMWLCIAGAIVFALLALLCVAGIYGILRMSRPLVLDRVADTISRGSDAPGKISEVDRVSVEKVVEEDDVVIHFKDPEQKKYDTHLSNMSGGADSRVAILLATFIGVKAHGFQGGVLYDPAGAEE
jgi:hypothetical protein